MNYKTFLKQQLKNEDFKREWCTPDAGELIIIRRSEGLTQKQLAKKSGVMQPAISRLENNSESATLKLVGKLAYALGYRAKLEFEKIE